MKKSFKAAAVAIAAAFLLIIISGIIWRACANHSKGLVIRWVYPQDHVPYGVVVTEGTFSAPGSQHPWQKELCEMERTASNEYSCTVDIPSGSEFLFAIRYVDSKTDKTCWVFDHSADRPCGGNGADAGRIFLAFESKPITFTEVSNGLKDSSGTMSYFDGKTTMP